jgi:hypothetical protein
MEGADSTDNPVNFIQKSRPEPSIPSFEPMIGVINFLFRDREETDVH